MYAKPQFHGIGRVCQQQTATCSVAGASGRKVDFRSGFLESQKQKRIPFLKNEPEKLLKTKDRGPKTNRNEPESEAEKLLKTRSCGKNEPKTNRRTSRAVLASSRGQSRPDGGAAV